MNKIIKAVLIIFSVLVFGLVGLILMRKSKGKTLIPKSIDDFKDDLGIKTETKTSDNTEGKATPPQAETQPAQEVPSSPQSLSEKGKTFVEQDNQSGKLIATAGIGAVGVLIARPVFGRVMKAGRAIATTTKSAITAGKAAVTASKTSKAATTMGKTTAAVSKFARTVKYTATSGRIAATAGRIANPILNLGKGAVSAASKVAATAGIKTAARIAGKLFLPLTIGMALWDTKTLAEKKKAQGSLSVGDIVGQYTGLGGLGLGKKLPNSVMSLFNTKAL